MPDPPLLGPAASRRAANAAPPAPLAEPLPPFVRPRSHPPGAERAAAPPQAAEPAPDMAPLAADPTPMVQAPPGLPDVRQEAEPSAPPVEEGTLAQVAAHLERIAGTLRTSSRADLLARAEEAAEADPLDLLIIGYALGFAEVARRGESQGPS